MKKTRILLWTNFVLFAAFGASGCGDKSATPAAGNAVTPAATQPARDPKSNKPTQGKLAEAPVFKSGE